MEEIPIYCKEQHKMKS